MEFLYATDLHGDQAKYKYLRNICLEHRIPILHIGADILPKGKNLHRVQSDFIEEFLRGFYTESKQFNLKILAHFGNDDLYHYQGAFLDYAELLDHTQYSYKGFTFKAYGYVPDYPFSLKTACKLDHKDFVRPKYLGNAIDIDSMGAIYHIDNAEEYFQTKGTIEEDLEGISADNKTIMSIHCPPAGCDLDVCMNGRRVGSISVQKWIEKTQPLLVLCGHIHENFMKTNNWRSKIGNTTVIQPGQGSWDTVHFVHIKIDEETNEISADFFTQNIYGDLKC